VVISQDGTYLVSYFTDGSVEAGDYTTTLYLNDAPIDGESISFELEGAAGKTILLNLTAGDTLSLFNDSPSEATVDNASLTVLKLA
jgi:hypothetical protein